MRAKTGPRSLLQGWFPIIGAFSIWLAHFLLVYVAALIWPREPTANVIAIVATVPAVIALAFLYAKLRSATPASGQTEFARRFGLGSVFIAAAGVLFDAAPALFA